MASKASTVVRPSQSALVRPWLNKVNELRSEVLGTSKKKVQPKGIASAAGVPDAFLEQTAVFIETVPDAKDKAKVTADQIRTTIARSAAAEPLASALEALARDVRAQLLGERAAVGGPALDLYDYAKGLERVTDDRHLSALVKDLKQTLGRGRKKKNGARKTKAQKPPSSAQT